MIEVLRRQSRAVHSGAYGSADSSHPPESFIEGGEGGVLVGRRVGMGWGPGGSVQTGIHA